MIRWIVTLLVLVGVGLGPAVQAQQVERTSRTAEYRDEAQACIRTRHANAHRCERIVYVTPRPTVQATQAGAEATPVPASRGGVARRR